jgi:hypothetical protein
MLSPWRLHGVAGQLYFTKIAVFGNTLIAGTEARVSIRLCVCSSLKPFRSKSSAKRQLLCSDGIPNNTNKEMTWKKFFLSSSLPLATSYSLVFFFF